MTRTELTELVIKAQKGDNSAIEQIYTLTHNSAYNKIYSSLNNPMDAEDILQNCYLTIIEKIADLKEPESFEKWFNTIIANKIKDHKKKKAPIFLDESEYNALSNSHEKNPELIPHENLERTDNIEAIRNLINELSDKNRQAIEMFYFKNKSISEIAKELNVSENAVKARLHNGRKEIKNKTKINTKKILITILVLILLAVITVFSVSGSDGIFSKLIYKIREHFIEYRTDSYYFDDGPDFLENLYTLSYIPDGFELVEIQAVEEDEKIYNYREQYSNENVMIVFKQFVLNYSGTTDNENTTITIEDINGFEVMCIKNQLHSLFKWNNDQYMFSLDIMTDNFPHEEAVKMIESLTLKDSDNESAQS